MSEVRQLHDEPAAVALEEPAGVRGRFSTAALTPRWRRRLLLTLVPLLVVGAALYVYLAAGRHIETDNAYVKSDRVMISAEISGVVAAVAVADNQPVAAGELLFELRSTPYQIALTRAQADLAQVALDIEADKLAYGEALAEVDLHQTDVEFARSRYVRQQQLRRTDLGTVEDLDSARHEVEIAQSQVALAQQKAARLLAGLGGRADISFDQHPRYQAALAQRAQAQLDLERTQVRAPFAGIATQVPRLGAHIDPGKPVMAVVADSGMWVEASFKETQLTHIRPGQSATVTVDAYPGLQWQGRVESISEATGAEFALLPPQNATGNWVKIVQRVPLKVTLEPRANSPVLRLGMSATVVVDTGYVRSWRDLLPD